MKPANPTRKVQTDETTSMSDKAFADLKQALEDALAFERGESRELRITRIEGSRPPKASIKIQRSDKTLAPSRGRVA
jgi:hypothetical protein